MYLTSREKHAKRRVYNLLTTTILQSLIMWKDIALLIIFLPIQTKTW
jgi:hypothetical protein